MSSEQSLAYFNYIRSNSTEVFEKPETWARGTRIYLNLLEKYPDQKWFWSWNWAAVFLSLSWMLYRKMFREVFLLVAVLLFYVFIPNSLSILSDLPLHFSYLFTFLLLFVVLGLLVSLFGLIGNPLYLNYVKRKVKAGKTHKSGTSWMGAMIGAVITTLNVLPLTAVTVGMIFVVLEKLIN